MSRSLFALLVFAGMVTACADGSGRRSSPQQGSPNNRQDPGEWFDEGDEETPGGGEVPDGGGGGGGNCAAAAKGWRSMASFLNEEAQFNQLFADGVWTGSEMFIAGSERYSTGCTTGVCERTVTAAYDPVKDTWRTLPSPWPDTFDSGLFSVWTGTTWLLHGRFIPGEGAHEGFEYDPKTNAWTALPKPPIMPLSGQSRAWSETTKEFVFFGGVLITPGTCGSTPCEFEPTSEGAAYSTITKTWRRIATSPLSPRINTDATWDGRRIVFAWGNEYCEDCEGRRAIAGVAAYDAATDTWEMLPEPPVAPRMTDVAETIGTTGRLGALWTGRPADGDGDFWPVLHDGVAWDGLASSWHTITDPKLIGEFRIGFASWSSHGNLFVWGGEGYLDEASADFRYYNDGASWNPSTRTWTTLPAGGPSPRSNAIAVWTGCDAIVYGGAVEELAQQHVGKIYRP